MSRSQTLFQRAQQYIPGGVNSPVRAFKAVGGTPVFIKKANGAYLFDEDDRRYIDYVLSWGPMILGHAHPSVIEAVAKKLPEGLSFGAPTEIETQLAQRLCQRVPNMELVRFVNSGTEATMSAIRLARGVTHRDKIVKFEGCYHGHSDSLLVKAGSGALTLGIPSSPGVPSSLADHTITLTYNDIEQVKTVFQQIGEQIAAIIVEPVAGNMNCVPPVAGFLQALREACDHYGAVLIFDEVMTGFRVDAGGAQKYYQIDADLITLGKVIGGGMPVGAFGGKQSIMEQIAPLGPVYQAGTLSGNPIAMAAGMATLDAIAADDHFYPKLFAKTEKLVTGLQQCADRAGIPMATQYVGSMFGFLFTEEKKITNYRQVIDADSQRFSAFFHRMLASGVYLAPASYEAGFMSIAHSDKDIVTTLQVADDIFDQWCRNGMEQIT